MAVVVWVVVAVVVVAVVAAAAVVVIVVIVVVVLVTVVVVVVAVSGPLFRSATLSDNVAPIRLAESLVTWCESTPRYVSLLPAVDLPNIQALTCSPLSLIPSGSTSTSRCVCGESAEMRRGSDTRRGRASKTGLFLVVSSP